MTSAAERGVQEHRGAGWEVMVIGTPYSCWVPEPAVAAYGGDPLRLSGDDGRGGGLVPGLWQGTNYKFFREEQEKVKV